MGGNPPYLPNLGGASLPRRHKNPPFLPSRFPPNSPPVLIEQFMHRTPGWLLWKPTSLPKKTRGLNLSISHPFNHLQEHLCDPHAVPASTNPNQRAVSARTHGAPKRPTWAQSCAVASGSDAVLPPPHRLPKQRFRRCFLFRAKAEQHRPQPPAPLRSMHRVPSRTLPPVGSTLHARGAAPPGERLPYSHLR